MYTSTPEAISTFALAGYAYISRYVLQQCAVYGTTTADLRGMTRVFLFKDWCRRFLKDEDELFATFVLRGAEHSDELYYKMEEAGIDKFITRMQAHAAYVIYWERYMTVISDYISANIDDNCTYTTLLMTVVDLTNTQDVVCHGMLTVNIQYFCDFVIEERWRNL